MSDVTWSNGSLTAVTNMKSSDGINDKKRYFEIKILSTGSSANLIIGICGSDYVLTNSPYTDTKARIYGGTGEKSTPRSVYGSSYAPNDIISVLVDFENNTIEFWKNGISQGVAFSDVSALTKPVYAFVSSGNSSSHSYQANFGASPFTYSLPTGYFSYDGKQGVRYMALKNLATNQQYSLAEKTLIHLPDLSPKNIILHGIIAGKEIQLDEPFDKITTIVDNADGTQTVTTNTVSPFSVYDHISENPQAIIYTESINDVIISTTTEPYDFYDEFGDELEILVYTDSKTVSESNLTLVANWTPIDELEGDFEVVTWTEEEENTAQIALEMITIPKPQFVKLVNPKNVYGNLSRVLANDKSKSYKDEVRYLFTDDSEKNWYVWDFEGSKFTIVDASTHELILQNGMKWNDIALLTQDNWQTWQHDYMNIGIFLKDNIRDTIVSGVESVYYDSKLPRHTTNVEKANLYILNTTAKIDINITGNTIEGVLSDEDLTRVQYRVLLNNNAYFPSDGSFTELSAPPQNINLVIPSKDIKIDDWNVVRVEFKDSFGTVDYWQTSFMGVYSGLLFKDIAGDYYSNEIGEMFKYLDFGIIVAGQTTIEHEIILKNQYGYDVKNLHLYANTNDFPDGMSLQFSKTLSPFVAEKELLYIDAIKNNQELSFYVRISTVLGATPNINGLFDIIVKADKV